MGFLERWKPETGPSLFFEAASCMVDFPESEVRVDNFKGRMQGAPGTSMENGDPS